MSYQLARKIHLIASKTKTELTRIHSDPVHELVRCIHDLYIELNRMDHREAYSLKFRLWQLKSTILWTLRPFDCSALNLESQLQMIISDGKDYSSFIQKAESLVKILGFFHDNPENHKRSKVFEILESTSARGKRVGLVTRITQGKNPGWSEVISKELQDVFSHVALISSPTHLEFGVFESIIVPGAMRDSRLKTLIHHGCRAFNINLVAYEGEEIDITQRISLPSGLTREDHIDDDPISDEERARHSTADKWVYEGFWEYMRGDESNDNGPNGPSSEAGDRQFLIKARLVLLATDEKVFLRDDAKILEISELIDEQVSLSDLGNRLPRQVISDLREGHLIVLRTSGSGDYLVEVADALLASEGREKLRGQALDWKEKLKNALTNMGVSTFYRHLVERGHKLSDYRYPWQWTSHEVMKPESKQRFMDVILILHDLGYTLDGENPVAAAELRWNQMQELQRYHRKAGNQIRRGLLKRLNNLIDKNVQIDDKLTLTLPGVDAGELTVFRIAGVDPEAIGIPYTRVGVILAT